MKIIIFFSYRNGVYEKILSQATEKDKKLIFFLNKKWYISYLQTNNIQYSYLYPV